MKFYDSIEEANQHPEEGRRLYRASLNGTTRYAWAKQGNVSGITYSLFSVAGGSLSLVEKKRRNLRGLHKLSKHEALAELDRLRRAIESRPDDAQIAAEVDAVADKEQP